MVMAVVHSRQPGHAELEPDVAVRAGEVEAALRRLPVQPLVLDPRFSQRGCKRAFGDKELRLARALHGALGEYIACPYALMMTWTPAPTLTAADSGTTVDALGASSKPGYNENSSKGRHTATRTTRITKRSGSCFAQAWR